MTPRERTMPIVEATFDGRRWYVALPGGGEGSAATREGVVQLVRHSAPGSAIRFTDGLTPAPPAGPDLVSSASVGVKQGQAQPAAAVDLGGAANPTTGNQPSPASALTADLDGAGQLSLALGTAT